MTEGATAVRRSAVAAMRESISVLREEILLGETDRDAMQIHQLAHDLVIELMQLQTVALTRAMELAEVRA